MARKSLKSIRRAVLTAAASVLLFTGSAEAIIFHGNWDPAFGSAFPNLGFRGDADFDASAACLVTPGFVQDGVGGCNLTLLSASLELYNASLGSSAPTLQTLTFAPPAISPDPLTAAFVAFNPLTGRNEVTGISTIHAAGPVAGNLFGPQISTLSSSIYSGPLWLEFSLSNAGTSDAFIFTGTCTSGSYTPKHYGGGGGVGTTSGCVANTSLPSNAAAITITQVPEPGTIALLLSAIGAGWLTRRLRKS